MRVKVSTILAIIILGGFAQKVFSYPPAVGILGNAKSCMSCHVNNGPWSDENKTIIDILDKETMKSLRRSNGTFLIEVKRGEQKTVLTVIGRTKDDNLPAPFRNAWTYVDSSMIGTNSISKFVPGWAVNLQMACRLIGDKLKGFENAEITALPMTVQPLYDAIDGELILQAMITKGESVKGNAKIGMLGNYFERKVILKVIE